MVVALVVLIAISTAVPTAFAGGYTGPPPSDEVHSLSENVSAWQLAILPLRADTDDAAETIDNANWFATSADREGDLALDRNELGVYDAGATVDVAFDLQGTFADSSDFAGEDVQVLTVRLDESFDGDVPSSQSEAMELVATAEANDDVTVVSVEDATLDKDDGGLAFERTPAQSGQYFYAVAAPNDPNRGFQNDDGDLVVDGNVVVLGVEHLFVRSGSGSATVTGGSDHEPGDAVTFDVDAGTGGDHVEQGVVLYNEDQYAGSNHVVEVDGTSVTSVDSSIGEVNGEAALADEVGAFGVTVGDGSVSGTVGIGFLADLLGEDSFDGVEPGEDRLAGSITVVNQSADSTITVDTFGNWTEGTYQWVYFATGDDSSETVTRTGTVQLEASGGGGGGGGGGDPGDPGDGDPGDSDPPSDPGGGDPTETEAGNETETETETEADTGGDDDTPTEEPDPTFVEVTSADLGAAEVVAGESVTLTVTLENTGNAAETHTLRVRANTDVVATRDVTVAPGETVVREVSFAIDEPGAYEIRADGTSAGTLKVVDPELSGNTPAPAEPPKDDAGLPFVAIGVAVALVWLGAVAYFLRK